MTFDPIDTSNGEEGVKELLLDAILADHREIEALLAAVATTEGSDRQNVFEQLVRKLVAHEIAEQEVAHPLAKEDGEPVTKARLEEEDAAMHALAALEDLGTFDPEFEVGFAALRKDVLDHARAEEQYEHPLIQAAADEEHQIQLGTLFRAAQKLAPTHPHPKSPESATASMVVGSFWAVADRIRDAIKAKRAHTDEEH